MASTSTKPEPDELFKNFMQLDEHKRTTLLSIFAAREIIESVQQLAKDLDLNPTVVCFESFILAAAATTRTLLYELYDSTPPVNPTLDSKRLAALYFHNCTLAGADGTIPVTRAAILEQTTREYAVRYENVSPLGEVVLTHMQKHAKGIV